MGKSLQAGPSYSFRLYIAGATPRSTAAIRAVHRACEEYLHGRCRLSIIDIYQHPEAARAAQIVAIPTLIKDSPLPVRTFIGDLSRAFWESL